MSNADSKARASLSASIKKRAAMKLRPMSWREQSKYLAGFRDGWNAAFKIDLKKV